MLKVARGTMRFKIDLQPRFDYGRGKHTVEITEHGALFRSDSMELTLHTSGRRAPGDPEAAEVARAGDGLSAIISMQEGQTGGAVRAPQAGPPRLPRPPHPTPPSPPPPLGR